MGQGGPLDQLFANRPENEAERKEFGLGPGIGTHGNFKDLFGGLLRVQAMRATLAKNSATGPGQKVSGADAPRPQAGTSAAKPRPKVQGLLDDEPVTSSSLS